MTPDLEVLISSQLKFLAQLTSISSHCLHNNRNTKNIKPSNKKYFKKTTKKINIWTLCFFFNCQGHSGDNGQRSRRTEKGQTVFLHTPIGVNQGATTSFPFVFTSYLSSQCFSSVSRTLIRMFWRRNGSVDTLSGCRPPFRSSWCAGVR